MPIVEDGLVEDAEATIGSRPVETPWFDVAHGAAVVTAAIGARRPIMWWRVCWWVHGFKVCEVLLFY